MLPKRYNTVAPTRDLVRSNSQESTETASNSPNNDHFWTDSICEHLKTFNDTCSLNNECNSNDSLLCINGICECNSTQFWNNGNIEEKDAKRK
ncbi:unnamed protein product [Rotaria magnacalcarata]|uniref:EB domain-containing protein n=1 Tax=Rotaria magnacalcarata TaxID=392030 RepID=A0A816ZWF2_9BILA|nr:unnamed protein product [Rotaria magnacalcarata]CAF3843570.1 unnamed protein product [Rotaria magnacalcarata]CAF4039763.1 unnamed protein product [Rotaria magnacalcarata]